MSESEEKKVETHITMNVDSKFPGVHFKKEPCTCDKEDGGIVEWLEDTDDSLKKTPKRRNCIIC